MKRGMGSGGRAWGWGEKKDDKAKDEEINFSNISRISFCPIFRLAPCPLLWYAVSATRDNAAKLRLMLRVVLGPT